MNDPWLLVAAGLAVAAPACLEGLAAVVAYPGELLEVPAFAAAGGAA